MRRRALLLALPHLGLVAAAIRVRAEGRVYKVGILIGGVAGARPVDAFRDQIRQLGYAEGRNLAIELRAGESRPERVPGLVAELVALAPDVIVARSTPIALALKSATSSIPIVFVTVTDPVGTGLVRSLARPDGNVTGVTDWAAELGAKHVEMLVETRPGAARIAVLWNPRNPANERMLRETEKALAGRGLTMVPVAATSPEDLGAALQAAVAGKADALAVASDTLTSSNHRTIIEFLAQQQMPAIFAVPGFARDGALMAYGVDDAESYRHAARLVARILEGAKPAELPVEEPDRFMLAINLRTARALDIIIPPSLLARADEVIE